MVEQLVELVAEHPRAALGVILFALVPYWLTCLGIALIVTLSGNTCG